MQANGNGSVCVPMSLHKCLYICIYTDRIISSNLEMVVISCGVVERLVAQVSSIK